MQAGQPIDVQGSGTETEGETRVSAFRAGLSLAVLVLLTMLSYMDRSIIGLMVDPIKGSLGIDDIQFSLLTGLAFAIFYAGFAVPIGWLADRYSRRWIIFFGVSVWSLATAACGVAGTFAQFFLARVTVGAGEATLQPAGYAMVSDLFTRRRLAMAIGILAAGTSVGSAIALAFGGMIVRWAEVSGGIQGMEPWQTTFLVVGLPGLLIAPLVFLIPKAADRPRIAPKAAEAQASGYGAWLRENISYLLPLFFACGLICASVIGAAMWAPVYMMRHFGLNAAETGLYLGPITGICGGLGFVGSGWLIDRLQASGVKNPHYKYLITVMPLTHIAAVLAFWLSADWHVMLFFLALMLLFSPINSAALSHLQQCTPGKYRARTIALFMLVFQMTGNLVGPTSAAIVSEKWLGGPEAIGTGVAIVSAVFGVLATLCLIIGWRPAQRAMARADALEGEA